MPARRSFTADQRRQRLGERHHLATPCTDDLAQIVDDIVALHSSDPVTVHLSAAVRMLHPTLAAVDAALYDDRTLVRHHAMRRTLWVMTPATAAIAHAAATKGLVANERRRLAQLLDSTGVVDDPEAWLDAARDAALAEIRTHPHSTARQLGSTVPALRLPLHLSPDKRWGTTISAHTRVLLLMGFEGVVVRTRPTGSLINSQYRWAAADSWIAAGFGALEPAAAAGLLADRWLRSFGPAPATDLQWWTGWSARVTHAALTAANAEAVDVDGADGWIAAVDETTDRANGRGAGTPWVALLPGLDPTTMGWKQRDWYLDPDDAALLFDRYGNAGPTVWCDGRVVGGWVQRRSGEIAVQLTVDVGAERRDAIDSAAASVESILGGVRFSVRFPAPVQRALLA